ncbi:hypothetical protein CLV51_101471 [Chitinophaga niastensis]|uniref:Uncharacterized protein n=1 Tax=Chitinophaga niastensis TaxID=536980 RepID=A0A2P8HSD1_CHINA|nr:hypothetical protein [Chitinophaga niastensis]PSL49141.1 hypothetical protein CLV51_101471 [Chitinophaga niastensis]
MRLKTITLIACALTAASCNNTGKKTAADSTAINGIADTAMNIQAAPNSALDVKPLSGYFVKNTIKVTDSLTFWIIDNAASFDSLFGMAKTMSNTIETPDFGTHLVVAATMPATYYGTQIQLEGATVDNTNNGATMHFVATSNRQKSSASMMPLWIGTIPKTGKSTIKLYTGDNLTKTIIEQQ